MSARRTLLWSLALAAVTTALFWPAVDDGFFFDDRSYIVENTLLQKGFTREGIYYSFFRAYASNWHPLTWLSHTLDLALFGLNPAPHHAINVLLHAANAALLLWLLCRWTGAFWPPLLVSALFALHPLRVESVAWVSERKDLLCGLFWLLALHAHLGYARRPCVRRYLLLLTAVVLALLSKPMAVTLPFALLLADYWPLDRLRSRTRAALLEKIPLLALALFTGLMTLNAQGVSGATRSLQAFPLHGRIANAVLSLGLYVKKLFLPVDLTVFYPYQQLALPDPQVLAAAAVVLAVTAAAVALRRRAPWLTMGWCWYLVTVAPVLGLIQVGNQARADRYTYLPLIGVAIGLTWGGRLIWARRPRARPALAAMVAAAVLFCAAFTWRELGYWDDPELLFRRALAVTKDNWKAQMLLGLALDEKGRAAEAEFHYRGALEINPSSNEAHFNLGALLFESGRVDEAIPHLEEARRQGGIDGIARQYLEAALATFGRGRDASPPARNQTPLAP